MARNRWLRLAGTAAALVLGVTAFALARGDPPNTIQDDHPPPSAGLLRRLAESADAYRTGRVVYLVAQDSGYFPVLGGFASRDEALAATRNAAGGKWYVYATMTPTDYSGGTPLAQAVLPGCYKDTKTTLWVCPPKDSLRVMALDELDRIDITFVRRTGRPTTVSLDPAHAGATIYTLQDFDRFIVPYYTRVLGPAQAARMREDLLSYVRRSLDAGKAH